MKITFTLIILISFSFTLQAQKYRNAQDSIKVFYDALFAKLKEGYLYKDTVNWQAAEKETNAQLINYTDFKSSLAEVERLFHKIGATHCAIRYEEKKYSSPHTFAPESFSEQWKKKYATNPQLETKLIDGKYGYILLPAVVFYNTRQGNVNKVSQEIYDQINAFKTNNKVEAWIIDLRFNTGGNSWPMLLGLYDFLGDHNIATTLDVNKKLISTTSFSAGKYLMDGVKMYQIKPKGALLDEAKVALLTGAVTASSGEVVAMAFKGRPNSIIIGENTMGFTSANYGNPLPFNATLILTKNFNADGAGNFYKYVSPDIPISKEDNFDDLLLDKNIAAAISFFNKKG